MGLVSMTKKKIYNYIFEDENNEEYTVTEEQLDRAIGHLEAKMKKNRQHIAKRRCSGVSRGRYLAGFMCDGGLRCRQLPNIAYELRKAILKQNWKQVVNLTLLLCRPGISRYSTVIFRTCLILLFSHPKSNFELIERFLRSCTNYFTREDVKKFIKVLNTLREEPLPVLHVGTYIRNSSQYRIIDDISFKNLFET